MKGYQSFSVLNNVTGIQGACHFSSMRINKNVYYTQQRFGMNHHQAQEKGGDCITQ